MAYDPDGKSEHFARWLVRLRWRGIVLAAVVLVLLSAGTGLVRSPWLCALVLGILAAANLALDHQLRRGNVSDSSLFGQLGLDVAAITVALHLMGGVENPFQVYYVFPTIISGIVLPRSAAYGVAGLASALYLAMGLLEYAGVLPHHDVGPLPFWRATPAGQGPDQFEDAGYLLGAACVLLSTLLVATYLTTQVAERLRAQEHELAASRDRIEAVLRALGEGVAFFDHDGRLVLANAAFDRLVPATAGLRLLERAPAALRPPLTEALGRLAAGARHETFEAAADGRVLACGLSRAPGGVAWVVEDVTDRREAQARAETERRLMDLGVLAAGLAHEVLNPLASVASSVQLAQEAAGGAEPVDAPLRQARRRIAQLAEVVRSVADLARPPAARGAPSPLLEVCRQAIEQAREERPGAAEIALDAPAGGPTVVMADGAMSTALKNLLTNAIDATDGEGPVTLRVRAEPDAAVVEVEDGGPGLGAEPAARLFVPFFTTKPPSRGTGLGLPIARSIVREHGGEIAVDSAPGRGTRVTVRLPRQEEDAA
ncbi:MAG: ATP-binding protein [Planctomycetes bacterium]|nr:ATP-binding protein [Planctomycetota bacterium]